VYFYCTSMLVRRSVSCGSTPTSTPTYVLVLNVWTWEAMREIEIRVYISHFVGSHGYVGTYLCTW